MMMSNVPAMHQREPNGARVNRFDRLLPFEQVYWLQHWFWFVPDFTRWNLPGPWSR